tara:strand:- start:1367 stop:3238 length:1872 start_codon:yes stop_codon:yes gene_type:complete
MATVFRPREVSLFDTFYPIVGPVQPLLASQWADKQVTGDYTKDSELTTSSYIVADQRGGIGIKDMVEADDATRCWWSTCEIGYKGHILLPTLVTDCGNDTDADPTIFVEYVNELYVAFGVSIRKWVDGTSAWGNSLVTLSEIPTDGKVHKSNLYYACGADFERYDGSTWTDGTTLSGSAQPAKFLVEWDGKLFKLDNDGQLAYSSNEGVSWTNSALSTLPTGYFTALFLYRDVSGDVIIYLGTKQGVYALDYTNAKWIETELTLPFHDYACQGATWWRDASYIPSGMAIYRYVTSNPATVSLMGLDQDYGMPASYTGSIRVLLPGHNALYALVDATSALTQELYPASPLAGNYGDVQIYDNEGHSAVMKWDSNGWGVVYLSEAAATPITSGVICTADDYYRLWFAMDGKVFYVPLQTTIQNPLEVTSFDFGASGVHITPWFDADNAVIDKLATRIIAYATDTSSTEHVTIYYGLDYDDDTWTLLTNTAFTNGQINSDGETGFALASGAGLNFKAIRFKAELARGSTTTASPDLRWLRLSYIKLLDVRWGFTVKLDCSHNYRFQTSQTLLTALKTALEAQTLGVFSFKDGNSTESHRVRITQINGVEVGGKKNKGQYEIMLVAP